MPSTTPPQKKHPAASLASDALATGRRVINTESEGLSALADTLDSAFESAVESINQMKGRLTGRLIVAGIGKSGHVARKMAATLASTGTPSYFVHPGEASHGDLGMITDNDIVLMLSNSGENAELSDLIHYSRRHGIKLIAITSNADSTLASHADITILLPSVPEACPNGLAPTTSTTMMMALGDALAVALLEKMGLTPEQFKHFHPGGKLGQRLQTVADLMVPRSEMPIIGDDQMMDQALLEMTEKNLGAVIVVDKNDNLRGIITDGDLKRHMAPDLLQKQATQVMTTNPQTILSSALAAKAMDLMTRTEGRYLTSLLVMDAQSRMVGMIRLQDCLKAGLA